MFFQCQQDLHDIWTIGSPDHADRLMTDLEPFFQRAHRGEYPLERASRELEEEALTVFRSLFPRSTIEEVILISRSSLLENLESAGDDIFSGDTLQHKFRYDFRDKFKYDPKDRFGYSHRSRYEKIFRGIISDSFRFNAERSLEDIIWSSLWSSIATYIGFTTTENTEMADKMRCLINFQLRAIFLNERKGKLGSWLVLCG